MTESREIVLTADTMDAYIALFGLNDQNITVIEQECSVHIALRGNHLVIQGDPDRLSLAEKTVQAFENWYKSLNVPTTLKEAGIENPDIKMLADIVMKPLGNTKFLTKEDVIKILELAK